LADDGTLPARIHFFSELKHDLSDAKEYRNRFCSEKVRFGGLKQFIDGVPENHTGYFLEPYTDDPTTRGFIAIPEDILREMIINADREGFAVRLHAMGDAAVRLGLDCFEAALKSNGSKGMRHALEHVENITAADIPRFQELGVTASMQPRHFTLNIDGHPYLVGEERTNFFYALKSIVNTGAAYAHGSDAPVSELNPIKAIYAGVTRMTETAYPAGGNIPREKVSMYEILKGYTSGSAYVENFEDRIGTLEEGKLADIVVLSKNLFVIPDNEILGTKVRLTMMDGNVVYSNLRGMDLKQV
jgi:predicted amidohydrolase YtcJ